MHGRCSLHATQLCYCIVCRALSAALPALDLLPSDALAQLALVHLNSSTGLMTTLQLLVPKAFSSEGGGGCPNIEVLLGAGDSVLSVCFNLIELQLFHLLRAQAIIAHLRSRLAHKQQQHQHQAVCDYGAVTSSDCSGSAEVCVQPAHGRS